MSHRAGFLPRLRQVLLLIILSAGCRPASADNSGDGFPPASDFLFLGEVVPAAHPEVRERLEREWLLMGGDLPQLTLWVKRSRRYFDAFEEALRAEGVPLELRFLPVIESSLLTRTTSSAGAAGPWQFMRARGRSYGLRIDRYVDERLNLQKASRAAARHLHDLHQEFGSWHLAVAAYNLGDNGVRSRQKRQGEENYWDMVFPSETERYLPRLIVCAELLGDPQRYGIDIPRNERYAQPAAETIEIEMTGGMLFLRDLADSADLSFRDLWRLNPWIKGVSLPAGRWRLQVPPGSGPAILAAVDVTRPSVHVVKPGENLSLIGQRYGCSTADLAAWNHLNPRDPLQVGQRLILYHSSGSGK
jgi:hypothetical protein